MQTRIDQAIEERFTGLVKVILPPDKDVTLFISEGAVHLAHVQDTQGRRFHPGEEWRNRLTIQGIGRFFMQQTPARALLYQKVSIECQRFGSKKEISTGDLASLFQSFDKREKATLLHAGWNNAEAFIMLPGISAIPRRAILVAENPAQDETAFTRIQGWPETTCTVTSYECNPEIESAAELHLNLLFERISNHLLAQYGYLTGVVMVRSAVRSLMVYAAQNGWDLHNNSYKISDTTLFPSCKLAGLAYRQILDFLSGQLRQVVGASLVDSIKRQSTETLSPFYQSLANEYHLVQD